MKWFNRARAAGSSAIVASAPIERLEQRTHFTGVSGDYNLLEGFANDRTGTVAQGSARDSYHFKINVASKFNTILTGLTADADLTLYKSNHTTVVASATVGGTAEDHINTTLQPGDYYIDVIPFVGTTPYTLKTMTDTAGDTFATARDIGKLGANKTLRDGVGNDLKNPSDLNDYFKFTVAQPGSVTLKLTNLTNDADLYLYNSAQTQIGSSSNAGTTSDTITTTLQPGTYYAKAAKFSSGVTNFTFSYSGPVDGAGNNRSAAKSLGAVPPTRTSNEFVGDFDTDDFYKFTVAKNKVIHIALTNLTANANIALQSSSGTVLKTSSLTGVASDSITYTATVSGTFYVRVFRSGTDDTGYKLTIS